MTSLLRFRKEARRRRREHRDGAGGASGAEFRVDNCEYVRVEGASTLLRVQVGSPGGDLELGGETLLEHHQRVVARGIEVLLEIREDAAAIVMDPGGLAVHLLARARDGAPERLADGLVSETDAEDRGGGVEASDQPERDARAVRIARPRGDDDALGPEPLHLVERDLVVARHVHARPELTHVLDQVVGERVVVIQHENHGFYRIRGGTPAVAPPPGPPTSSCKITGFLLGVALRLVSRFAVPSGWRGSCRAPSSRSRATPSWDRSRRRCPRPPGWRRGRRGRPPSGW